MAVVCCVLSGVGEGGRGDNGGERLVGMLNRLDDRVVVVVERG